MFGKIALVWCVLQISGNQGIPVTNIKNPQSSSDTFVFELPKFRESSALLSRVSSANAAGRSYGQTSNSLTARSLAVRSSEETPTGFQSHDKDAIVYPDAIIRDSYGNIVPSYTPSTNINNNQNMHGVGFMTDINKDQTHHDHLPLPTLTSNFKFALPSYADGITQLQGPYDGLNSKIKTNNIRIPNQSLLPPLSSGNYNYPSLTSTSKAKAPVDNTYQNEVTGTFSGKETSTSGLITTNGITQTSSNPQNTLFTQKLPVIDTRLSGFTNTQKESTTNSYNTPVQSQNSFGTTTNQQNPNNYASSIIQIQQQKPLTAVASNIPSQTNKQSSQIPVQFQFPSSTQNTDKYTGGFGGAPGILGDDNVPGYAVPNINKPQITTNVPGNVPHVKPQGVGASSSYNVGLSASSLNQFNTAVTSQVGSSTSTSNVDSQSTKIERYIGSFGGPPGILSPYDNTDYKDSVAPTLTSSTYAGPKRKY